MTPSLLTFCALLVVEILKWLAGNDRPTNTAQDSKPDPALRDRLVRRVRAHGRMREDDHLCS